MLHNLDPQYFSSHSLRKTAATQMSAMGVSEENRLRRGNYTSTSLVMGSTYNFHAATEGPPSCSSAEGGRLPTIGDVRLNLPMMQGPK